MVDLERYLLSLDGFEPISDRGRITKVVGLAIQAQGPRGSIGELCYIQTPDRVIKAEIEGFREGATLLMPLGETEKISSGCQVTASGDVLKIRVGPGMTGRVLDGLGVPIDGQGPIPCAEWKSVTSAICNPLNRKRIKEVLPLGIKAIDGLLTCGKGQRLGVFSGSGVGKSTLLGMMARNTDADVNVIALIGERGREVNDFIAKDLGEEGLKRSVIVVATSDQPPLVRIKGAFVATAIAEYFREQGKDVLLMMDSVTRFAMAQREVGLAIGEPPTTKGYTPSVFTLLPQLLERAGTSEKGTITGLYTVLVEGDDFNEPIADAVRGTIDGHIILSRQLAAQNHYPAIELLNSVSRLMPDLVTAEHQEKAGHLRSILATYQNAKDLIDLGAYKDGSNPEIDEAIQMIDRCNALLQQGIGEKYTFEETVKLLCDLFS
ncbi:MAG TPA: flagellar protein export ATPase FliI [Peptococcaceae bacterium]|nr:flagellar protein export ATPase FliI [Peptococcaceae bacterium]